MSKFPRFGLLAAAALTVSPASAQWYQGPSGGSGGKPFDSWADGGGSRDIVGIGVAGDDHDIRCITIAYRKPPRHFDYGSGCVPTGGFEPIYHQWFTLKAGDYLTGVEGTYDDHLISLKFYTGKGDSRIFNFATGKRTFGYTAPAGQRIVAFIGRAGDNVDSLGVMYASIGTPMPLNVKVH